MCVFKKIIEFKVNKKFIHNKFIFVYTLSTKESGLNCCKNYFYNSQLEERKKKIARWKVLESHKNRLNFIQQSLHRKVMRFEEKKYRFETKENEEFPQFKLISWNKRQHFFLLLNATINKAKSRSFPQQKKQLNVYAI